MKTREKHADESYKTKNSKITHRFYTKPKPPKRLHNRESKTGHITSTKNGTQQRLHQQCLHQKTGTQKGAVKEKLSPPLL